MTKSLKIGDDAPAFILPRDGGGEVSLETYKDQPVVVYFYPKDMTPGCTVEAEDFTALAGAFDKAGATVIGISPDSAKRHDSFKAKHDLVIILGADEAHETAKAYGVWVEKSMYGRTFMGVERATFLVGADGKIAHIWRKVRVKGHAAEVLETAQALEA